MSDDRLVLNLDGESFEFVGAPLVFRNCRTSDLFSAKNNKTVGQTITHPRYAGLAARVHAGYAGSLDLKLGAFLLSLKVAGDTFYREFLNKNGDRRYCEFGLQDTSIGRLKGLYAWRVENKLKYIGRCMDSFGNRINQGYGRIHPKNCYRDGQSTNCHLNSLIAEEADGARLYVHSLLDDEVIARAEAALIRSYRPGWNIQLLAGVD